MEEKDSTQPSSKQSSATPSAGDENSPSASSGTSTPANKNATVCQNCQTSTTPLWRRDESGQVLCNACGLFLKLHGRRRPISLKTDVIKSRNRSRSSHTAQIKSSKRHHQQHPHHPMMALPPHVSPSFPPSTMSPHLGPQMSPMGRAMGPHPVVGMAPGSAPLYPHHPAQEVHSIEHLPPLANHHHHRGGGFYAHPRGLPAAQPMVPSTPSSVFSISPNTAAGPPPLQPHAPHAAHGAANSLPHGPISMLRRSPPHVPASGSNSPLLNGTRHGSNSPALPPLVGLGSNHERPKSGPASSMLTPQSRPHSPVSRHAASVPLPAPTATQVRVSARGEALTEQLRPRSPDHLDTIPPLRQIYRGGERPKSRVSELEIVNDLLKSRIIQLERSEAAARHSEACVREHELMLRKQIDELKRELDGKSRLVHDLQKRLNDSTTNDDSKRKHIDEQVSRPPQLKRIKVSDML